MDGHSNSRHDNEATSDNSSAAGAAPDHRPSESAPDLHEEVHASPLRFGKRDRSTGISEVIALPGRGGRQHSAVQAVDRDFDDEIDEHMPLPTEEEYHDDDRTEPDPHDVTDKIDEVMPRPTGDAEDEIDDFSTGEELDVDTAPSSPAPDEAEEGAPVGDEADVDPGSVDDVPENSADRIRVVKSSRTVPIDGTPVYVGGPSGNDPINDESSTVSSSYSSTATDADTGDEDVDVVDQERVAPDGGTDAAAPPLPLAGQDGAATCPICGRETDALRFCGYCGAPLTRNRREFTASSFTGRLEERAGVILEPIARWTRPATVRLIMAAGALLVLLALLANSGGLALVFGALILPLVLIFWCLRIDLFENEPPAIIGGFGIAGILLGALLGWLASVIVANSWFGTGVLNYGAAGYGGVFAEQAGSPPFLVWALVGIVVPLLALAAILGGPLAMRQTISLRNEMMDGLTLGAVMGAGYSIGTAIVFAAPMLMGGGPASDASGWTITTIGLTIIRPLIWTLSGGILGAAAWRYLLTGTIGSGLVPALVGILAPLLFTFVSIRLAPAGLWPEFLWGVLVAAVVGFFFRQTVNQAVRHDRRVLGNDDSRVVCPSCHQVTPAGHFCAHCGSDLSTHTSSAPQMDNGELREAK